MLNFDVAKQAQNIGQRKTGVAVTTCRVLKGAIEETSIGRSARQIESRRVLPDWGLT